MNAYYSVGLDIHKKLIAYCVKAADGRLVTQGMVGADRESLGQWAEIGARVWSGLGQSGAAARQGQHTQGARANQAGGKAGHCRRKTD